MFEVQDRGVAVGGFVDNVTLAAQEMREGKSLDGGIVTLYASALPAMNCAVQTTN